MNPTADLAQAYLNRGQHPLPEGITRWTPGSSLAGLGGIVRINSYHFGIKAYLDLEVVDVMDDLFFSLPSGTVIRGYEVDDNRLIEVKRHKS